jgi:hypothetical protein
MIFFSSSDRTIPRRLALAAHVLSGGYVFFNQVTYKTFFGPLVPSLSEGVTVGNLLGLASSWAGEIDVWTVPCLAAAAAASLVARECARAARGPRAVLASLVVDRGERASLKEAAAETWVCRPPHFCSNIHLVVCYFLIIFYNNNYCAYC